jgi:protein-S-isoprenylcysteine O-methyltransferase Ste14
MSVLALATGVNSASVWAEGRHRLLSRGFGRHAFAAHLALIAPPWSAAVAMIVRLPRHPRGTLPNRLRPLGWGLAAVAAAVWIDAFRRLGPRRTANGDIFGEGPAAPVRSGAYRLLRDPMYDAYALGLGAAALTTGNAAYLALAVESFVVLNVLEARIERLALEGGGAVPADGDGNRRRLRSIAEGEEECRGEGD